MAGSAYPGPAHSPLWSVLTGAESVACRTLENGSFGVVGPELAADLAGLLAGVDLAAVTGAVEEADLDDLVGEEELYDLELLEPGKAPATIVDGIRGLTAFYARVAADRLAVITYEA